MQKALQNDDTPFWHETVQGEVNRVMAKTPSDDFATLNETVEPTPCQGWEIHRITQLPKTPPIEWVFEGYLAKGRTTELVGIWKGGKTTFVANILQHMQNGGELVGKKVAKAGKGTRNEPYVYTFL